MNEIRNEHRIVFVNSARKTVMGLRMDFCGVKSPVFHTSIA